MSAGKGTGSRQSQGQGTGPVPSGQQVLAGPYCGSASGLVSENMKKKHQTWPSQSLQAGVKGQAARYAHHNMIRALERVLHGTC